MATGMGARGAGTGTHKSLANRQQRQHQCNEESSGISSWVVDILTQHQYWLCLSLWKLSSVTSPTYLGGASGCQTLVMGSLLLNSGSGVTLGREAQGFFFI